MILFITLFLLILNGSLTAYYIYKGWAGWASLTAFVSGMNMLSLIRIIALGA